jgi:apolipoprotein N-acyltransferase
MTAFAAAALAALCYAAAVPPWSLDVLAPVALAPLLWALRGRRASAALGLGLLCGLAFAAMTAWWVPAMLVRFFLVSPALAALGAVGIYLAVSGIPIALFAVGPRACSAPGAPPPTSGSRPSGSPPSWSARTRSRGSRGSSSVTRSIAASRSSRWPT